MDVTTADLRTSVAQQTRFALRLATTLSSAAHPAGGARSNMVFCPLTLQMALSLVAAGMAGATRDQLVSLLGVPRGTAEGLHAFAEQVVQLVLADASSTGGPHVAFANSVLVDSSLSLKQSFKDVAMGKYKAETHSVDFQTKAAEVVGQVNAWVDRVTSGLIKEIIPPESIGHTTRLVLGNALYFKGAWAEKFDVSETKDGEFHLLDGESVQAPFMSTRKMQYLSSYGSFKVLKLPYLQGGDKRPFSMYILLPEAQDGLWSLAEKLNSELEFLENHIPMRQVHVGQFMLPKFKISFGFEATGLLKGLGLHLLFSSEVDLIEMVDSPGGQNLFVSSIFHKSFIEVNEEGTESAAAVTATFKKKSKPRRVNFIADHPFLFLIREDITGVVLFIGHVVNPFLLHRVFVCRTL